MKINQPLKTSQVVVVAGVIVLVAAGIVAYFQTAKEEPVPVVQNIQNPVVGAQTLPAGENATSRIESSQSQAPIQNEAVDTSSWQTYRNDEYGFEVKYPDFPIQTKFPESEGYVFPCGKQLGDSFRIGSSEHFGPTIYDFTVYSNPQKMAAKDFFLCKINATSNGIFSESEINKIDSITVGEQKTAAFQIAWDNTIKTVLIANGGNMIEIQYDAGQAPDEFSQMLSTFKLIGANAEIGNALVTVKA